MHWLPSILAEMAARGVSRDALFHAVIEKVTVGVVLLDLEGRIQYANPAYCEMAGCAAARLHNKKFISLAHPDEQRDAGTQLSSLLSGAQEELRLEVLLSAKAAPRGGKDQRLPGTQ